MDFPASSGEGEERRKRRCRKASSLLRYAAYAANSGKDADLLFTDRLKGRELLDKKAPRLLALILFP